MDKLLLNEREAIEYLGGPNRIKFLKERDAGRIEHLRIGRLVKYPVDALNTYVELLRKEAKGGSD